MPAAAITKLYTVLLFTFTMTVIVTLCVQLKVNLSVAKHRRERALEAAAIARSLLSFELEHDGRMPSALDELSFGISKKELSLCRLLPPGARHGNRPLDVVIEVDGYQTNNEFIKWFAQDKEQYVIRIYSDNEVRPEPCSTKAVGDPVGDHISTL